MKRVSCLIAVGAALVWSQPLLADEDCSSYVTVQILGDYRHPSLSCAQEYTSGYTYWNVGTTAIWLCKLGYYPADELHSASVLRSVGEQRAMGCSYSAIGGGIPRHESCARPADYYQGDVTLESPFPLVVIGDMCYHSGRGYSCTEVCAPWSIGHSKLAMSYTLGFANSSPSSVCVNPLVRMSGITPQGERFSKVVVHRIECIGSSVSFVPVGLCSAPGGVRAVGLQLAFDGQWEGSPNICLCPGMSKISVLSLTFYDKDIDLDLDGRFTQFDVDIFSALVGTSIADEMRILDFNGNGIVDVEDVELLQALIDAGFGAGLLGDANQDGVVSCADTPLLGSIPDATLGQIGYRVDLDANLDGFFNDQDRAAICRHIQPADFTCDGVIDFSDYLAFLAEFDAQSPAADLNGDGVVDFTDFLEFSNRYDAGC